MLCVCVVRETRRPAVLSPHGRLGLLNHQERCAWLAEACLQQVPVFSHRSAPMQRKERRGQRPSQKRSHITCLVLPRFPSMAWGLHL